MKALEQILDAAARCAAAGWSGVARQLQDAVAELRPYFEPSGTPEDRAPTNSQHFRAWSAVVDVLNEVRGTHRNWGADDSLCPRDAAVATIRSMAAQCSAQPPAADERPVGVPAIPRAQLDALLYAIGYMKARDTAWPTDALLPLYNWLRANAPQE